MKTKQTKLILILLILAGALSCTQSDDRNYLGYVDFLIGTAPATTASAKDHPGDHVGHGQTIPAVTAPFGMTQWTPQVSATEKKCVAPYYTGSLMLQGFRATHWTSGSCVQDYGSFTFFPTNIGDDFRFLPEQRWARYFLNVEESNPAYTSVLFPEKNIITELTATKRSGFFRISWLDPKDPAIIIDVNSDEGEGYIKIDIEKGEIYGYNPVHRIYNGTGKHAGFSGYFVARFDKPINKYGTFAGMDYEHGMAERKDKEQIGAYAVFDLGEDNLLKMKVGTSFTSIENARANLEAEIPEWNFEKTKSDLETIWNTLLGTIDVESTDKNELTKFYTAMYHSLLHPRLYSDINGEYPGFADSGDIQKAESFDYYCDFSNWDIFRAQMPLLSIIAPEQYRHMVISLIEKAEQGQWLPVFPMWNSYTSAMIGDHSTSIIADAYRKGFEFDAEKAYKYMRKNAFEQPSDINDYIDGKGRRGLDSYLQFGYIPLEDPVRHAFHRGEQVSRTLEYAYNDWAVAQLAKGLEKTEDFNELSARALNYTNVYDPEKGWMCGRYADETFTDEFGENKKMFYITEGTPKHYTWYVPHDVEGLMELMGGKERFHKELTSMIANKEYWHGNEPSHQIPFLFNYADDWEMTQKTVKYILKTEYDVEPGGLSGNDDAGQMSAWYVFGAMGFYPVCPGSNEYQLSSPVFDKVTLKLDENYYKGKRVTLECDPGNNYKTFGSVKINGKRTGTSFSHDLFKKGGKLSFHTE